MALEAFPALASVIALWRSIVTDQQRNGRDRLKDFYEPLFHDLLDVHQSYIETLHAFRQFLEQNRKLESTGIDELIAFIEERRLKYAAVREAIRAHVREMRESASKLSQPERSFLNAIDLYLTSYFGGRTSFTGFLSLLELVKQDFATGQPLNHLVVTRRFQTRFADGYYADEAERIQKWLEHQLATNVCSHYAHLRKKLLGLG